ncbi:MAG TPA: sugar ABC transporter substrate-binding protein [Devosiaceae bacterium]|nr:sugar ABC transporter substrate-binding protein [Devosiaceae bacterium]
MIRNVVLAAMLGLSATVMAQPAAAQTTINFASWQLEEPGNSQWWKSVLDGFRAANPDITVQTTYIPFADYLNQMTVRFASGRPPSVIQLSQQTMGAFAAQGWLASLDDRIKGTEIATDWAPSESDLKWDGQERGVLVSNSAYMLFYNQKVLADAGVSVPTDFASFKADVAKITNKQTGIFGLAAVTTEHPTVVEDFTRFLRWQGTDVIKDGKYNLTSPEAIAAINVYRKTVGENAPLGNNSAIARQLFLDGKTGFIIDGPWFWSWLAKASPEVKANLKMIRLPFGPQLAPGGISLHLAGGLDKQTEDAAWKFILYATGKQLQRDYLVETGQPAGRASTVLSPADEKQYPYLLTISQSAADAVPVFPADQKIKANFAEYSSIIMKAALRALSTEDDTAAILKDAQSELEQEIPLN